MPAPYTLIALRLLPNDGSAADVPEELQEIRFAQAVLGAQKTGITLHSLRPDARSPIAHRHRDAEEVYVVLTGSGQAKLDDDVVELAAFDALRVAPAVTRAFAAGPRGMELLVVGASHPGDGELVQGFWN